MLFFLLFFFYFFFINFLFSPSASSILLPTIRQSAQLSYSQQNQIAVSGFRSKKFFFFFKKFFLSFFSSPLSLFLLRAFRISSLYMFQLQTFQRPVPRNSIAHQYRLYTHADKHLVEFFTFIFLLIYNKCRRKHFLKQSLRLQYTHNTKAS